MTHNPLVPFSLSRSLGSQADNPLKAGSANDAARPRLTAMRSPLQLAAALGACLAASTSAATTAMTDLSIGTLVSCPEARASATPCLWAGDDGAVIDSRALKELLLQRFLVSFRDYDEASRNLEAHMTYIEGIWLSVLGIGVETEGSDAGVLVRQMYTCTRTRSATPSRTTWVWASAT